MTSKPPPDEPVFFLDRCLGKTTVAERLRAAGHKVEVHFDHFPETEYDPEPSDESWLVQVGRRGWVILSKDKHLHRNQIEISALLKSGAPSFVLTAGQMTGEEMAEAFLNAMPTMRRFLTKFDRPFLATVTRAGIVKMFLTWSELIKKVK